jgi:pSer/pThr/pTyr-binding forkhead associated (FHA) protein
MFALEIVFNDATLPPETVLIRRPSALVGGQDFAHVVLDDMASLDYQVHVVRGIGRSFSCTPVGPGAPRVTDRIGGTFYGSASIELGVVTLHFTSLDLDCCLKENEAPDKAGVRVVQAACRKASPHFPALVVRGLNPVVLSFPSDSSLLAGRSKECFLRFDSVDISSQHARIGHEEGNFWVEDVGSTNGTFTTQDQVSGRQSFKAGETITLGRELAFTGVVSDQQLQWVLAEQETVDPARAAVEQVRYPVLVSVSEVARPTRVVISLETVLNLGRDPASDMWLGAPHISRKHASIKMFEGDNVEISDHSTNGIGIQGETLGKGKIVEIGTSPVVLDFGGAVTVGICFDEMQEQRFVDTSGGIFCFDLRTQTDRNIVVQPQAQPRLSTVRDFNSQSSDDLSQSSRRTNSWLVVLVVICAFALCAVIFELVRGTL